MGDSCYQDTATDTRAASPQKRNKASATEQSKKAAPDTAAKPQPKPAKPQEQPAKQALPAQAAPQAAALQNPAREFAAARDLVLTGKYEAGIKAMHALGFDTHPDVAAYVGLAHSKLGRPAEAASWYDKALAGNPKHLLTLSYYGMLRAEQGDLAKAQQNLDTIKGVCGGTTCKEYIALDAMIASKRR
jgi:tetratricopeptide (TPR) repeat protein